MGVGSSSQLSEEQSRRWRRWLEDRGCVEHVWGPQQLSAGIEENGHKEGESSADREEGLEGEERESSLLCSICLQPFASTGSYVPSQQQQQQQQALSTDGQTAAAGYHRAELSSIELDVEVALPTAAAAAAVDTQAAPGRSSSDGVAMPIVVCYPCSGRHVFHAACLHAWLQITYERTGLESRLSCPCCRQHPT
jgi:hypothetical protein